MVEAPSVEFAKPGIRQEHAALDRRIARDPGPASAQEETKEHQVLSAIALHASILLDVVDSAGRTANINEIRGVLDAARLLTATIGSLADAMTGENKRGDQYGWHNACPN